MLLIILVRCFKPLIFPITAITATRTSPTDRGDEQEVMTTEVRKDPWLREGRKEEREVSEALRRWKQSRSERKAMLLRGVLPASSTSNITREEPFVAAATTTTTEEVGDSESVTFGGSTG